MTTKSKIDKDYQILLHDLKDILAQGNQATDTAVKKIRGQTYKSKLNIKNKIFSNFKEFLKEIDGDFSITDRQVAIKIDGITNYINLVLYNKSLPCSLLIDIKNRKFDSGDVIEMNKYISYYRQNKQRLHEQETIGLIICQDANKEEIKYALDGLEEKIFIAKYKIKLPSEEAIKKAIHQ